MRNGVWLLIGAMLVAALVIAALILSAPPETPTPQTEQRVSLHLVAEGLDHPIAVAHAKGIEDRSFVVDQIGVVSMLMNNGTMDPVPFLDLRDRMMSLNPSYDERGLLSLAFHPDYPENHKLYVFYAAPLREGAPADFDHTNVISELTASADGLSVDRSTERVILAIDHPSSNHNGGQVLFGPDGLLYITTGDGGGGNDVGLGHNDSVGNAQDPSSIHGKVLRIDVDDGDPYGIPAENPYAGGGGGLPEIFALGFRNPAYATFDPTSGDLLVADAGQARYEEVDLVVKGGNYGWRFREGAHCFDPNDATGDPTSCPSAGVHGDELIDPIAEFRNSNLPGGEGSTVIGGAFYHGNITSLDGGYVFGAFDDGSPLFVLHRSDGAWARSTVAVEGQENGRVPGFLLAVGSDNDGDVLVLSSGRAGPSGGTGKVWRLVP
jgi:glucose/arabinose dehydrogenase